MTKEVYFGNPMNEASGPSTNAMGNPPYDGILSNIPVLGAPSINQMEGMRIPGTSVEINTRTSHAAPAIYKAMSSVQKEVASIGASKNRQGPGWKFRGIEDVYELAAATMPKHGLISVLEYGEPKTTNYQARNGGAMVNVVIKLLIRFIAVEDGSHLTMCFYGEGSDTSDKAINKAMTDAQKYAFFQAFWVPYAAVEDPDYEKVDRETQNVCPDMEISPYCSSTADKIKNDVGVTGEKRREFEVEILDQSKDDDKLRSAFEALRARVAGSRSIDEIDSILRTNAKLMAALKERKPESHERISKIIQNRRNQIEGIR